MGSRCKWHPSRAVEQGKIVGQKAPFKIKGIWTPRVRLDAFDAQNQGDIDLHAHQES